VAVLLVEQYQDFSLKIADRCYVMDKGQVVMERHVNKLDREAIKQYLMF